MHGQNEAALGRRPDLYLAQQPQDLGRLARWLDSAGSLSTDGVGRGDHEISQASERLDSVIETDHSRGVVRRKGSHCMDVHGDARDVAEDFELGTILGDGQHLEEVPNPSRVVADR